MEHLAQGLCGVDAPSVYRLSAKTIFYGFPDRLADLSPDGSITATTFCNRLLISRDYDLSPLNQAAVLKKWGCLERTGTRKILLEFLFVSRRFYTAIRTKYNKSIIIR